MSASSTSADLTIVTAASSNHFRCLENLLTSLVRSRATARTLVYDLGLSDGERAAIRARPVHLRPFPFANYPKHLDIRLRSGCFAWKPVIVADVLAEFGPLVLWLDAGDLVYGDLRRVRRLLLEQGFYSPVSDGDIRKWTHPGTLRALAASDDLLPRRNRNGAIVGLNARHPGVPDLARRWRAHALDEAAIAPPGSDRSNHRQDQALLSILAYQLQARHPFRLVDRELDISIHNDSLPAYLLPLRLRWLRLRSLYGLA